MEEKARNMWSRMRSWFAPDLELLSHDGSMYKHIKSGVVYHLICYAQQEKDGIPVAVYENVMTGTVWVRPTYEFLDPLRFQMLK